MPKASRQKSAVTQQRHETMAAALLEGKLPAQAAAEAGYTNPKGSANTAQHPDIQRALSIARSEVMEHAKVTQAEIVEGIKEAIGLARLSADPGSMIRGYSEIAKICGLNAPEVKKIEHTIGGRNIVSKYEMMSDEALMELINNGSVIEGEASRIQ